MRRLHYSSDIKRQMTGRKKRPAFRISKMMLHDAGIFLILFIWVATFFAACLSYIGLI